MNSKTKTCLACPGGPRDLPLAEFGINRRRPDGRSFYCRECTTRAASRRREARRAGLELIDGRCLIGPRLVVGRPPTNRDLVAMVLELIARGSYTQRDIVAHIFARYQRSSVSRSMIQDRIGEVFGELFAARLLATRGEAEQRIYYARRRA